MITQFQSSHGNKTPIALKAKGQSITSDLSGCLYLNLMLNLYRNESGKKYGPPEKASDPDFITPGGKSKIFSGKENVQSESASFARIMQKPLPI